jgi:hypothetical protein
MDRDHHTESVEAGKRDKLNVRPGYGTQDDHSFVIPDALKGSGYTLSSVLKPDFSEALEMPGGVCTRLVNDIKSDRRFHIFYYFDVIRTFV